LPIKGEIMSEVMTTSAVPQAQGFEGFAPSGELFTPGAIDPAAIINLEAACIPEVANQVPGHENDQVHLEHRNGWELPQLSAHEDGQERPSYGPYIAKVRSMGARALIQEVEPVANPLRYDREALLAHVRATAAERTAAYVASHNAAVEQRG
jgi:hypothetical protein